MRWGVLAVAAAAVMVVAGCGTLTGGIATPAATSATLTNPVDSGNSTAAVPSATAVSPMQPTQPAGQQVTVGAMSVTLPAGVRYLPRTPDGMFDGCLSTATAVCAAKLQDLSEIASEPDAPFNEPGTDRQYGWYTGTDVPLCTPKTNPPGSIATGSRLLDSGLAPIGPKRAVYGKWQVTCAEASQSGPVRMWWLPKSKILITEYGGAAAFDAEMDRLLAGATFGS